MKEELQKTEEELLKEERAYLEAESKAYIKWAREFGYKAKPVYLRPGESSLHDIIRKNPKLEERLMKALKLCEQEAEAENRAKAPAQAQANHP